MLRSTTIGRRRRVFPPAMLAGGLAAGVVALGAVQTPGAGIQTATQADNGRAVYERECAACHLADLSGAFEAPPLTGTNFLNFWGDRSPRDLFQQIKLSMPQDRPGGLEDQEYVDIVAYILRHNGAPDGSVPLTMETTVAINSVTTGEAPPAAASPAPSASRPRASPSPGRWTGSGRSPTQSCGTRTRTTG